MAQRPSAKEVFREKLVLRIGLIREGVIWKVPISERFPEGVKYRLALVEPESGHILVLFDNHFPKGHHQHCSDGSEVPYQFVSMIQLIEDFLHVVSQEVRKYESQKNSN